MLMLEIAIEHAKMFGIQVLRNVLCPKIKYSVTETSKRTVVHLSPTMPNDEAAQLLFGLTMKKANCMEPSDKMVKMASRWYSSQKLLQEESSWNQ